MEADMNKDGKISFDEFTKMVENTDVSMSMTLSTVPPFISSPVRVDDGMRVRLTLWYLIRRVLVDTLEEQQQHTQQFQRLDEADDGWA